MFQSSVAFAAARLHLPLHRAILPFPFSTPQPPRREMYSGELTNALLGTVAMTMMLVVRNIYDANGGSSTTLLIIAGRSRLFCETYSLS